MFYPTVKHSFFTFFTTSTGIQDLPECQVALIVDDIPGSYCNSNGKMEVKNEMWKKYFDDNPQLLEFYTQECSARAPHSFKALLNRFNLHFSQSGGTVCSIYTQYE